MGEAYARLRFAAAIASACMFFLAAAALGLGLGAVPVPLWERGISPEELESGGYGWSDGGILVPIYTGEEIRRFGGGTCAAYVGAVASYALRRGMTVYALVSGRHAIAYIPELGAFVDSGRVYYGLSLADAAKLYLGGGEPVSRLPWGVVRREVLAIRLPWGPVYRLVNGTLVEDPLGSLLYLLSLPTAYLLLLRLHWFLVALLLIPSDAPEPLRLLPFTLLALGLLSALTPVPF